MTTTLRIKDGRYYAVVSYKEGTAYKQKWITLDLPAKNNKRKAEAKLDELKPILEERFSSPGGEVPFVAYLRRWLEKKQPFVEQSTWEGYKIYVEKHLVPYFEPLKLALIDVKPSHIKDYYEYKYTQGRMDGKPGGLSIPSIKKHSIVLKEALNDAMTSELISRNPATGVRLPAKDVSTREKVFLTADQANEVMQVLVGHPLEALVYITLYYGLRRSEVLGLRWSAIDFEKRTLTINHTVVKNLTIVEKDTTKSQTSNHTYILIEDVRDLLLKHRERQERQRENFGPGYHRSDYVFTREDGTLLRPDYITRSFQRVLKAHGLQVMRFHDLRHNTASILYDKGWDLKDSQIWMRHASVDITGDIYTHISEDRKKWMAEDLNSMLKLGEG